jgi:putative ABC transport system permease protein
MTMGAIRRGTKNAFRNTIRTVSISLILGISFALALVMILSLQAVKQQIRSVSASSGTTITVTPAGFGGFGFGGGNPLSSSDLSKIKGTAHVVSVIESVTGRLVNPNTASSGRGSFGGSTAASSTTNLVSSVAGGALGGPFGGGSSSNFVPPIQVTGTNEPTSASAVGATSLRLVSGSAISGSARTYEALVGSSLATKNGLTAGSRFTAYDKTFTVEGIFTTNSTFTNAGLIMPLRTVETLSGVTGPTSATVTVDSIDNVSTTASNLQRSLGTSAATVSVGTPGSQTVIASYNSIEQIALYSLIGALVAGSIILLLSMIMIVRERRQEIGVLKAFGSSNRGIVSTFVSEAMTLTLLGGVLGVVLGALLANPVLGVLQRNSSGTSSTGRGLGFGRIAAGFRPGAAISELHAAVGPSLLLYGVLSVVVIALIGSAAPSYLIAKIRPAEVMRSE